MTHTTALVTALLACCAPQPDPDPFEPFTADRPFTLTLNDDAPTEPRQRSLVMVAFASFLREAGLASPEDKPFTPRLRRHTAMAPTQRLPRT